MINQIVFDNEITLWWTYDEFMSADRYEFFLNEKFCYGGTKTHCSFVDLLPNSAYTVSIKGYRGKKEVATRQLEIVTKACKNAINVTDKKYGAVGDGKTLNTVALQKALDDCTENDVVIIPKGEFLSGALDVKSNTEIYLESGAVILGSKNESDYLPKIKSRFEGIEYACYRSLINIGELTDDKSYGCKNVILRGKGCISGGGINLHVSMIDAETERLKDSPQYQNSIVRYKHLIRDYSYAWRARGRLINISCCDGVIISGLDIEYGPSWTVHPIYSKNVVMYKCNVTSIGINNGDGFDPDSSRDCAVFDTTFDTGDDCIAIKSGKNPEGNVINVPSKNIYVFDCKAISGHSGVAIGSEMSGGVSNVFVWDCDFSGVWYGVHIKGTKERGGYVKNVGVKDCSLSSIIIGSVDYNTDGESADSMPKFSNFYFENCEINGFNQNYISITGFDDNEHAVTDVSFSNVSLINMSNEKSIKLTNCKNVTFDKKVKTKAKCLRKFPKVDII